MIPTLALLAALTAPPAAASAVDAEHFSVVLPVELDLVGLAFGLHPELLWRPFRPDGAFHLRAGTGAMVGPELALVPVSLGVREVFLPRRTVRPGLGAGVQLQGFFPYGHAPLVRLDQYVELTLDVRLQDGWLVGLELAPESGWIGGFGLGKAARVGVQADLPLSRRTVRWSLPQLVQLVVHGGPTSAAATPAGPLPALRDPQLGRLELGGELPGRADRVLVVVAVVGQQADVLVEVALRIARWERTVEQELGDYMRALMLTLVLSGCSAEGWKGLFGEETGGGRPRVG